MKVDVVCTHIKEIKEVLAWVMNKYFQFSNNLKQWLQKNKAI